MSADDRAAPPEGRSRASAGDNGSNAVIATLHRFKSPYTSAALILCNTLIWLLLFNLVLAGVFWIRDGVDSFRLKTLKDAASPAQSYFHADGSPVDNGKRTAYQLGWVDFTAYDTDDERYVSDVLDDFYELSRKGMAYQPWVLFSEPPFRGRHVTVELDSRGFPRRRTLSRYTADGRPAVTIMAFGGSTTFGYNVGDEQTWPSFLADTLNERARWAGLNLHITVLNYGRGYYYPSQETVLLIDLLRHGHRPDLVIFLDGVNWSGLEDVPEFYRQAEHHFRSLQFTDLPDRPPVLQPIAEWLPMIRLAEGLGRRLFPPRQQTMAQRMVEQPAEAEHLVNGLRQNRVLATAICRLYGITPLFILQPHALIGYPPGLYRRPPPDYVSVWRDHMRGVYARVSADRDLVNLSGLFALWGDGKKAIIDELHYSPSFNRFLAEQIANHIDLRRLSPRSSPLDESAATGGPRQYASLRK